MLPTPSTSHVEFDRIYEPAEDSYLLLDTLSSEGEKAFLQNRFKDNGDSPSPLIVEIGTGSGVVLSFVHAHSQVILGRSDILSLGIDVNSFACKATEQTVMLAEREQTSQALTHGEYLGNIVGDLTLSLRPGEVDVLVFNPPYVPTADLPALPGSSLQNDSHDNESHLLSLSYAGGADGMETTNRLLEDLDTMLDKQRGCAYILLCAQNNPLRVKEGIKEWGRGWGVETVGTSGKKAGWEKLQVIRIFRVSQSNSR